MMARILQGTPFQVSAVALAAALLIAGLIIGERRRAIPGLPDDGDPLECWEWDEMDRIQAFYAENAADPVTARNAPRRGK